MSAESTYTLWGGCFEGTPARVLQRLNCSLSVDQRLFREDIRASQAYAAALAEAAIISEQELQAIHRGLEQVECDIEKDILTKGRLTDSEEDIHTVVEKRLWEKIGDPALKLHTARSRNDQVATDTRLWLLNSLPELQEALKELIEAMAARAGDEIDALVAGYTHLQRAQPVRWSHFLLSHAWSIRDDYDRLIGQIPRLSRCPLGSGALAGCALPIDRRKLASKLGFQDITMNSMHAVSDRDFIVEFLNWSSLCSAHLSRLSEDLILYSSQEFAFVRLSDEFSTGSSLMPHKRNPDGLELVRGAAGSLLGDAVGFLASLKGLPSSYNKDLQTDKEVLFRSYDKLTGCLKVLTGTITTLQIFPEIMKESLEDSMLATEAAYVLVERGVPFRTAHAHAGTLLRTAARLGTELTGLPQHEFTAVCGEFPDDMSARWSREASVERHRAEGGTARAAVLQQLTALRTWLADQDLLSPTTN